MISTSGRASYPQLLFKGLHEWLSIADLTSKVGKPEPFSPTPFTIIHKVSESAHFQLHMQGSISGLVYSVSHFLREKREHQNSAIE
jgi:hypothetical protein